jgi:hypothetical protein
MALGINAVPNLSLLYSRYISMNGALLKGLRFLLWWVVLAAPNTPLTAKIGTNLKGNSRNATRSGISWSAGLYQREEKNYGIKNQFGERESAGRSKTKAIIWAVVEGGGGGGVGGGE